MISLYKKHRSWEKFNIKDLKRVTLENNNNNNNNKNKNNNKIDYERPTNKPL